MIIHNVSSRHEDQYTVHCSKCKIPTPQKNFATAGDAADLARRANWVTKFRTLSSPAEWFCPECG